MFLYVLFVGYHTVVSNRAMGLPFLFCILYYFVLISVMWPLAFKQQTCQHLSLSCNSYEHFFALNLFPLNVSHISARRQDIRESPTSISTSGTVAELSAVVREDETHYQEDAVCWWTRHGFLLGKDESHNYFPLINFFQSSRIRICLISLITN